MRSRDRLPCGEPRRPVPAPRPAKPALRPMDVLLRFTACVAAICLTVAFAAYCAGRVS